MNVIRKSFKILEYYWEKYSEAKKSLTSVQFNNYISQLSLKDNINFRFSSDYGYCVNLDKEIFIQDTVRVTDVRRIVEKVEKKFFGTKKVVTYAICICVESIEPESDKYYYRTSLTTKDTRAEKLNKGDMINILGNVKVRYYVSETYKFWVDGKGLLFSNVN